MRGVRRANHGLARTSAPQGWHSAPAPSTGGVTGGAASPEAIAVMPMAQVIVQPFDSQYATIAYQGMMPLWAPDGGTILASAPYRWGQLRMAGRP